MIYVLLDDKKRQHYTKTFYEFNKEMFKIENKNGWGVYFTVNDFQASEEERIKHNVKTSRNIVFLKKLRYVFADLDIAKAGDGMSREQKESIKQNILVSLVEKLEPTKIINTSNGLQPLWKINEESTSKETQEKYINIINGIIEWSKTIGCAGDKVKDVTRILRMPGFYHMKEEPYLCEIIYDSERVYTLDQMKSVFWSEEKKQVIQTKEVNFNLSPIDRDIQRLDIKDVTVKAFRSTGRQAEFDRQGRLLLDGRLTGTFNGKNGDKQYLASTSHEPYEGNKITVVADILGINNKEARKWIIDEFHIDYQKSIIKQKVETKLMQEQKIEKKESQIFTWGTDNMDRYITSIKNHKHIVLVGESGGGKTTMALDIAIKNAKHGKKILFLSLEMPTEELKYVKCQDYAGITKEEDRINKWSKEKEDKIQERIKFFESLDNLIMQGTDEEGTDIEFIIETIRSVSPDLVIIDNLDLIQVEVSGSDLERQETASRKLMNLSKNENIPTILLHHYKKKTDKGLRGQNDVRGSSKIVHNAHIVIKVERDMENEDSEECLITMIKDRRFGKTSRVKVFYRNGSFYDDYYINEPKIVSSARNIFN